MGTITNVGLNTMASLIANAFTYIANGIDPTAEAATDTTLGSENTLYGSARKSATVTTSAVGMTTWDSIFYFNGPVTVREYGIFSASSAGNMLYRRVLSSNRSYVDGDSMEVIINHSFSRGE